MSNYLIGSHNSWSFKKPMKWWKRAFRFMAKCQSLNIEEQYNQDVRVFDVRIKFTGSSLNPIVAHGYIEFCSLSDITEDLEWLATLNSKTDVYVRVLLENSSWSTEQETEFKNICQKLEEQYPNIKFFGGTDKTLWHNLYEFKNTITLDDKYSSVTSLFKSGKFAKIDDFWPWLYARLNNKKLYSNGTDKNCLFIDFVNIR